MTLFGPMHKGNSSCTSGGSFKLPRSKFFTRTIKTSYLCGPERNEPVGKVIDKNNNTLCKDLNNHIYPKTRSWFNNEKTDDMSSCEIMASSKVKRIDSNLPSLFSYSNTSTNSNNDNDSIQEKKKRVGNTQFKNSDGIPKFSQSHSQIGFLNVNQIVGSNVVVPRSSVPAPANAPQYNRSGSGCSYNAGKSVSNVNENSIPATARTTTSRRGGRTNSQSRSPIIFLSNKKISNNTSQFISTGSESINLGTSPHILMDNSRITHEDTTLQKIKCNIERILPTETIKIPEINNPPGKRKSSGSLKSFIASSLTNVLYDSNLRCWVTPSKEIISTINCNKNLDQSRNVICNGRRSSTHMINPLMKVNSRKSYVSRYNNDSKSLGNISRFSNHDKDSEIHTHHFEMSCLRNVGAERSSQHSVSLSHDNTDRYKSWFSRYPGDTSYTMSYDSDIGPNNHSATLPGQCSVYAPHNFVQSYKNEIYTDSICNEVHKKYDETDREMILYGTKNIGKFYGNDTHVVDLNDSSLKINTNDFNLNMKMNTSERSSYDPRKCCFDFNKINNHECSKSKVTSLLFESGISSCVERNRIEVSSPNKASNLIFQSKFSTKSIEKVESDDLEKMGPSNVMTSSALIDIPSANFTALNKYNSQPICHEDSFPEKKVSYDSISSVFRESPGYVPKFIIGNTNVKKSSSKKIVMPLLTQIQSYDDVDDCKRPSVQHNCVGNGRKFEKHGNKIDDDSSLNHVAPLSPETPPQIQLCPNSIFFNSQHSPNHLNTVRSSSKLLGESSVTVPLINVKSTRINHDIYGASSFNLFNQSFDSLGDTVPYLNPNDNIPSGPLIDSADFRTQLFPQIRNGNNNCPSSQSFSSSSRPGTKGHSTACVELSFSPQRTLEMDHKISSSKCSPFCGQSTNEILTEGIEMTPKHSYVGHLSPHGNGKGTHDKSLDPVLKLTSSRSPRTIETRTSLDSVFGSNNTNDYSIIHENKMKVPYQRRHFSSVAVVSSDGRVLNSCDGNVDLNVDIPNNVSIDPIEKVDGIKYIGTFKNNKRKKLSSIFKQDSQMNFDETNYPHFYHVLLCHKQAFNGCTYLLPGLKAVMLNDMSIASLHNDNDNSHSAFHCKQENIENLCCRTTPSRNNIDLPSVSYSPETKTFAMVNESYMPSNVEIARRRVKSAICAFGGTHKTHFASNFKSYTQSIFRTRSGSFSPQTPGYKSTETNVEKITNQKKYAEQLSSRYYENENRLSWDIEDLFPFDTNNNNDLRERFVRNVHAKSKSPSLYTEDNIKNLKEYGMTYMDFHDEGTTNNFHHAGKRQKNSVSGSIKFDHSPDSTIISNEIIIQKNNDQPKMRYRCKLCGQPKQNHTCPYQQSLQRSIGIMIYPAVNAFTACEPGYLAPALADMNNFVSESESSSAESTPSRSSVETSIAPTVSGSVVISQIAGPPKVTPETLRGTLLQRDLHPNTIDSPVSSMSTLSSTPQRTPFYKTPASITNGFGWTKRLLGRSTPKSNMRRKLSLSEEDTSLPSTSDLLFVEATDLRPEQYRIVSKSMLKENDSFSYPSLPLPYAQRKRLSDNLFSLSKKVPHLTDECALVLREAREDDMWDEAVADLITQVIVVLKCKRDDLRLDGLSQYLLHLGFSC